MATKVYITGPFQNICGQIRAFARGGRPAITVPHKWLRVPTLASGDQLVLFVTYAPDGLISQHSLVYARAWAMAGFKVNLTVVLDNIDEFSVPDLDFASGILLRLNKGYDFGAWAATMQLLPHLRTCSLVAIANDSVYGPFRSFPVMLDRVRSVDADIIGITESFEVRRHFQSYLMFFRATALSHPAFLNFWRRIRTGDRQFVINEYELKFMRIMERNGLKMRALFPSVVRFDNPTLSTWLELIDEGFPFIKVQLLLTNPRKVDISSWKEVVQREGFDPQVIEEHLTSSRDRNARPWGPDAKLRT